MTALSCRRRIRDVLTTAIPTSWVKQQEGLLSELRVTRVYRSSSLEQFLSLAFLSHY